MEGRDCGEVVVDPKVTDPAADVVLDDWTESASAVPMRFGLRRSLGGVEVEACRGVDGLELASSKS